VGVAVGVFVRMRMLALARMRVGMLVLVAMLVRVVVGVLVVALHGRLLCFVGDPARLQPSNKGNAGATLRIVRTIFSFVL
jgi:hypothetical protein